MSRSHRTSPLAWAIALAAIALAGCAARGRSLREVALEVNATLEPGPTVLLPGDSIQVVFPEQPDYTHTALVRPDGGASFSWIGEQAIGGLAVQEAEARLRAAYTELFPHLQVAVTATLLAPRHVYVMGEVHRPGEFPVTGRLTLIEALGLAGGPLKETALLENTLLVRWSPSERRQHSWRIDAKVDHWGESTPLLLQPHDVVFVPNTPIDDVNIWVDQYIRRMLPFPYIIPPLY